MKISGFRIDSCACQKEIDPSLDFYLPYFKKAYTVKVVEIDGEKETILNERKLISADKIKTPDTSEYIKRLNCHHIQITPIN